MPNASPGIVRNMRGRLSMRSSLACLAFLPLTLFGQHLAQTDAGKIVEALLSPDASTGLCLDDSALAVSQRLGITYEGVTRKCLISYDLDDSIKARLRNKEMKHSVSLFFCGADYDRLTVTAPQLGVSRDFYFRNGCLTAPFFCLTREWKSLSSRFFRFVLVDSTLTNPYAIETLDGFVSRVGALLGFSEADFATLERHKILYYLCRDEAEIHRLTGFRTRGMYNVAYDAIVSTYNAHLHEVTHLLVNFKLKHVELFAHPFLQEGLAVALGGRGGLSPDVVLQLGVFLDESQMLRYPALLRRSDFSSFDASLSYPVAGLYNRFLVQSLGAERYLALYKAHCGIPGDSCLEVISPLELPAPADWDLSLREERNQRLIQFHQLSPEDPLLWQSEQSSLYEHDDRYLFAMGSTLQFGPCDTLHLRHSNMSSDHFPGRQNSGHRYAAVADSQTVSIYDVWTNTLIASHAASFDVSSTMVPMQRGKFIFTVPKSLFSGAVVDKPCAPRD